MEAKFTLNGRELSDSESSILRVALSHFMSEMNVLHALGRDERGEEIRLGYLKRGRPLEKEIVDICNSDLNEESE